VSEKVEADRIEYLEALSSSSKLYEKACDIFPNGVTHDLRKYEPFPIYASHAEGGRKWDVDGREYVDLWMGHGSLLLGHCFPDMVDAVGAQVAKGTHYGACHELEVEWGMWVKRLIPTAERVRFTGSGTEATLMALRLARTYTGKRKVLKFIGHFHGWHDNLMIGVLPPFDEPVPAGILKEVAETVALCPPNDIERVEDILGSDPDISCVIVEPTGASFGTIPTRPGFLNELREITRKHDVLLVFDEVITGFRCSPGGAQAHFNISPDLTSLAKVLAGGLPGGALVGRKDILELLEFRGDREWDFCRKMPHQGTFNANPVSAAAGIATLKAIESGEPNRQADKNAEFLRKHLNDVIRTQNVDWAIYGDFSGVKFLPNCGGQEAALASINAGIYDYKKLKGFHPEIGRGFRTAMQLEGVDMNGMAAMTSSAHTAEDLEHVVQAFNATLTRLKSSGLIKA